MRPRKLDADDEEILVMMFEKVRRDMKGRSNQFQVASKLISYFPYEVFLDRNITNLDEDKRRLALRESTYKYFGLPSNSSLDFYIARATPAAIVQMVKRINYRYKTSIT